MKRRADSGSSSDDDEEDGDETETNFDFENREVEVVQWTEKRNTKKQVTAMRFVVKRLSKQQHSTFYRISGRFSYDDDENFGDIKIKLCDEIEPRIHGRPVMDLRHKQNLTTNQQRKLALWTIRVTDYISPSYLPPETNQDKMGILRSYNQKRSEFFKSIYCTKSRDDDESLPDTDSNFNLSLCSGDTEHAVIESLQQNITNIHKLQNNDNNNHNDDNAPNPKSLNDDDDDDNEGDEGDDGESDEGEGEGDGDGDGDDVDGEGYREFLYNWSDRAYYDQVSYCKAMKLDHFYSLQTECLSDILPLFTHIHIPDIMDFLRLVHRQPQTKQIQHWTSFLKTHTKHKYNKRPTK